MRRRATLRIRWSETTKPCGITPFVVTQDTHKPKGATGGKQSETTVTATDSCTDQGLEVERIRCISRKRDLVNRERGRPSQGGR